MAWIPKPVVYVAGPISKGDMHENALKACDVGHRLYKRGVVPLIPHLDVFWVKAHEERDGSGTFPWDYEAFLDVDFNYVIRCDAVLRIEGDSPGADREVAFAESLDIPVFHDEEAVVNWALDRYTSR